MAGPLQRFLVLDGLFTGLVIGTHAFVSAPRRWC